MKTKILFFTPYSGRTGSEMFLWYMFKQLDPKHFEVTLISDTRAELLGVMPSYVTCHVSKRYQTMNDRMKAFVLRIFGINYYEQHILSIHKKLKPDFWYLNTVMMADKIELARKANVKVVSHIHELMTDYSLVSSEQLNSLIEYSHLIIGDSDAVCGALKVLGAKNVKLQYECIDLEEIKYKPENTIKIRREIGLEKFKFVWLMSGTTSVRKGTDMVCELAKSLAVENMALIWLGNNSSNGMDLYIQKYAVTEKLHNLFFLGKKVSDYYDYMDLMDGFVLTSREEPFGMVVTEALYLGKPVVAFNAGGVSEIVVDGTGRICQSWNIVDLVENMKQVANGQIGFNRDRAIERAKDFDVRKQFMNWKELLLNV